MLKSSNSMLKIIGLIFTLSILITPVNAENTLLVKSVINAGIDVENSIFSLVLTISVSEVTIIDSVTLLFGNQEDATASLLKTTEYYSAVYLYPGDNLASLFISTTFTQAGDYSITLFWRDGCSSNQAVTIDRTVLADTTVSPANHYDLNEENTLTCNTDNVSTSSNPDGTTPVVSEDQNPLPIDFSSIVVFSFAMIIIRRRSISRGN